MRAKWMVPLLTIVMIMAGIFLFDVNGSEVQAEENTTTSYITEAYTDISKYRGEIYTSPKPTIAGKENWIFAGWYTDSTCTTALGDNVPSTVYAKFVPADVMSVKCQVTPSTDIDSTSTNMRLVTTVDSLKYREVGFDVTFKGTTVNAGSTTVYKRIFAKEGGTEYGYSPSAFAAEAQYFATVNLVNINNKNFSEGFFIQPYWKTLDGTKVYGVSRMARVEDSYLKIVNVPVRLYTDTTVGAGSLTVDYNLTDANGNALFTNLYGSDEGNITTTAVADDATAKKVTITTTEAVVSPDGMLANLRFQLNNGAALSTINIFVIESDIFTDACVADVAYKNFATTYDGTPDTSWYDEFKNEDTFVVTTVADLYGFAGLVNGGTTFEGKTVYVGADITAIDGDATAWGTTPPTSNEWVPIGNVNDKFAGTFDGQGNTVKGIYVNDDAGSGYVGFFGQVSGTIKNFSLENSYINSTGNMVGSIAGFLTGSMEGISSKATVINSATTNTGLEFDCGGLVGRFGSNSETKISNCWFDGSVTSNNRNCGAIAGRVAMGTKTIEHCLNTGNVHNTISGTGAYTGGLVGGVVPQETAAVSLAITDSLNVGSVTRDNDVHVMGSVIGTIGATAEVSITDTYATNESYIAPDQKSVAIGTGTVTSGAAQLCDEATLTGYTGYLKADLDFYTDINKADGGYWVVNPDTTPTLKSFEDNWADVGWYFDDDDITTYEISTVDELYGFAALSQYYDFSGETIKLTADITVNKGYAKNWGTLAPENAWTPINASKALPFAGTFDGQGHTISGIYVNKAGTTGSEAFAGLFGATATDATIKNLRLENSYIYGTGYFVGSIAGRGNGTFDTVYSDAIVISDSGVIGGIAGQVNANTKMSNCWFDGVVNQSNTGFDVGGLFGTTSGVLTLAIDNCLNTGTVTGKTDVGGIIGRVRAEGTFIATNNLNIGVISATTNAGNILANNLGIAKIASSYGLNMYSIVAAGTGTTTESNNVTYEVTAMQGDAAYALKGLDYTTYWVAKTGVTPELKSFTSDSDNLTPSGTQSYIGWYNSWDSEYTITTAAGLYGLSELSQSSAANHFLEKTVKLGADITINSLADGETAENLATKESVNTWTPIGTSLMWGGTFDGQGYTIRGLYVNRVVASGGSSYSGLFGQTTGRSTIRNFRLEDSYIYGSGYIVGGIAGRGNGKFDTIYSNALVVCDSGVVGGFIGQVNSEANITNCWFDGNVNQSNTVSEVGGFVGATSGTVSLTIDNCLNSNKISGKSYVGGLVGQIRSGGTLVAVNNLNVGTISATSNAGNIVGNIAGTSKIANSYGVDTYPIAAAGTVTESSNATYAVTAIQGDGAYAMTGLDFTTYWTAKTEETPELKSFTSDSDSLTPDATQVYKGWYNTWDSEYTITTAAGLCGLSELSVETNFYGKTIKLGADITVNEGTLDPKGNASEWEETTADWAQWTPIGSSARLFNGTFDGQGYTIRGIYIKDSVTANADNSHAGLFGVTNVNAKIQNLRLKDSYIEGKGYYVGSIVGQSAGTTFSNIYSNAIVKGHSAMAGGLIGAVQASGSTISNCWYDGRMPLPASGCQAGGLVGVVRNGGDTVITNCLNTADISSERTAGNHWVGGLVGALRLGTPKLTITNSLNVGKVAVAGNETAGVGELVGHVDLGTLEMNNTVYGVKGDWSALGTQGTSVTVTNTASLVEKASLMGDSAVTSVVALFEDGTTWTTVIDGTPVLKEFAEDVTVTADTSWYNAGMKEFTITTAAELLGFAELSKTTNFANKIIKLGADITLNIGSAANWATEAPINKWTPIVEFAGTFDGQGHTISGLYVYDTDGNAGLFAKTTVDSTVKNLSLTNSYIYGTGANNGSIAGTGSGAFDTIYSNAIVESSYYYVGGIVGYVCEGDTNKISNTWFAGKVVLRTANGYYAGGIVGEIEVSGTVVTIENCMSSGSISCERTTASGPYSVIGGLCGSAYTSGSTLIIKNSVHTGTIDVVATGAVGTAVGRVNAGKVQLVGVYGLTGDYAGIGVTESAGTTTGSVELMDEATIAGEGAFAMTGLDFTTYWTAKEGALPELKSFSSSTGSLTAPETQVYTGWYDGSGDYTITTSAGLYGFAQLSKSNGFTGETIKLGADITLNDGNATEWSSTNAPANVFTPIAFGGSGFFGTFDGQGHTISGVYIKGTGTGTGLFYWTDEVSTIKNLRLENSYIYSTYNQVGSIAGYGAGTYENIYSNAIVEAGSSNYYIGGILGSAYQSMNTNMSNCWFAGAVNLGASGYYAGGVVGASTSGATLTMNDCLMSGTITGDRTGSVYIGGLCGTAYGGTANLNSCLYTGTMTLAVGVTYTDSSIGAIDNNGIGNIANTYVTTRVNETGVGSGKPTGSVTLIGTEDIKGEGAFTMTGLDFTDKWAAVEGKTPELATFSSAERLLPDGTQVYTGWYDGSGDYTIATAAGLYGFAELSKTESFAGDIIRLGADITLNKGTLDSNGDAPDWNQWTPIGKTTAFAGTFDGQGHTISGIYVNETSAKAGLFGQTTTASTIQNLRLVNSYISSTGTYVGSIVGYGDGNINSVYSNAIVKSSSWYVGGIVGYIMSNVSTSKIANCWFDGTMILTGNSGYYAGGILGTAQNTATTVTIENCLNSGNISWERTSDTVAIGGLCGATYLSGNVAINKSLQTGGMNPKTNASTSGAGLAIGYISGGSVSITDTYTVAGTISASVGGGTVTATGTVTPVTEENLLGDNAKTNASALFTDGTTWTTITDGIPVLTNFKEYGAVESAETLLGAPLSRYRIVISEDATALMELLAGYLQEQVAEQTGVTLEIVSDATEVSNYEIVLGSTTREVSSLFYTKGTYSTTDYSYAMKNEGNGISVGYSDSPALVDAFTKLLDVIANDDATSLDITNTYDMTEVEKAENSYIRVMSSNIYNSLDTSFDHLGMPYQARAELLAECYLLYKPDFIGWQEADQVMRDEVYKHIASEYAMVELDMGGFNNWCPIFYRKDLYNLEVAGFEILDSMHDCEWALYSSKSNPEEQFIHMNIHYNVSEATALSQAVIVNKMIKKLMVEYPNVPMAITGDYNFTASEGVFKTMMRGIDDKVQSGSQILQNEDSKYYTWHTLGSLELKETYNSAKGFIQQGPIDHVSITTDLLEAKTYKILHYPLICWAADHYPIFLDMAVR